MRAGIRARLEPGLDMCLQPDEFDGGRAEGAAPVY